MNTPSAPSFRRVRVGAFFYVAPDTDSAARDVLRRGGFTPLQ